MSTIIELKQIHKTYGNLTALDQINLQIPEAEIFSLLGPNGSGKTTLLRILAGIEKPTQGELTFKGKKIHEHNMDSLRFNTTMVFQKTVMFNTNVHKNISYGLELRGLPKTEINQRITQALKVVKLEGYEKRQAKKLSGGEQQRVAIARALALDTEILLLDEPTANVDPKNASIIEDILSWVNKQYKKTIIMATHNMFQAETLANKAALLLEGRITRVGTPQEILTLPTQLLVNYSRLENVFSGTSRTTEEGTSIIDVDKNLQIEAAFQTDGNISAYVRPEDIIISAQPIVSSARNTFQGRIIEIIDLGSLIKLKINAGKDFTAQITKRSFNEMQLNLDSNVFIAFKASAVQKI